MPDIEEYLDEKGRSPFGEWLKTLDRDVRARVRTRIDRIVRGNFGDSRHLAEGVYELRLDFGPGYRIYYGRAGPVVVILLCGGDKSTQRADIDRARRYWLAYSHRVSDGDGSYESAQIPRFVEGRS